MAIWYTDSARSAIRLALKMEGLDAAGDGGGAALPRQLRGEALLPAYLCDTLLAPFHQRGLILRFYDVNPDLSIDLKDLSRRLGPRTQVFLFIHYFGFPQPEPVRRSLSELARLGPSGSLERSGSSPGGPVVIEDLTHAVWTEGVGRIGHYAVASYRKFGQPFDGGFLRRNRQTEGADEAAKQGMPTALDSWAGPAHCLSTLAWSVDRVETGSDQGQDLWDQVELALGRETGVRAIAPSSTRLLAEVDRASLVSRRRMAYEEALEKAEGCPYGIPLWPVLPRGVCPLVLPMQAHSAAERGPMRAWLARRGLRSVLHWPLAPGISPKEFPGAAEAAARLASLLLPLSKQENRAL